MGSISGCGEALAVMKAGGHLAALMFLVVVVVVVAAVVEIGLQVGSQESGTAGEIARLDSAGRDHLQHGPPVDTKNGGCLGDRVHGLEAELSILKDLGEPRVPLFGSRSRRGHSVGLSETKVRLSTPYCVTARRAVSLLYSITLVLVTH